MAETNYTDVLLEDALSKLDQLAEIMLGFREQLNQKVSKEQFNKAKQHLNLLDYSLKKIIAENKVQSIRMAKLEAQRA